MNLILSSHSILFISLSSSRNGVINHCFFVSHLFQVRLSISHSFAFDSFQYEFTFCHIRYTSFVQLSTTLFISSTISSLLLDFSLPRVKGTIQYVQKLSHQVWIIIFALHGFSCNCLILR